MQVIDYIPETDCIYLEIYDAVELLYMVYWFIVLCVAVKLQ